MRAGREPRAHLDRGRLIAVAVVEGFLRLRPQLMQRRFNEFGTAQRRSDQDERAHESEVPEREVEGVEVPIIFTAQCKACPYRISNRSYLRLIYPPVYPLLTLHFTTDEFFDNKNSAGDFG